MNIQDALKLNVNTVVYCRKGPGEPVTLGRVVRKTAKPVVQRALSGAEFIWLDVAPLNGGPAEPWQSTKLFRGIKIGKVVVSKI